MDESEAMEGVDEAGAQTVDAHMVDKNRREWLKLYEELITSIIRGPYLVTKYSLMKREHCEEVCAMDTSKGATCGAQLFLSRVLEFGKEGWFVELISALRQAGYNTLADCIDEQNFFKLNDLENQRNIIRLHRTTMESQLLPRDVVIHLEFLRELDRQEIIQETVSYGDIRGTTKLIDHVLRSDEQDLLKQFKSAIIKAGTGEIADLLEGKELYHDEDVQNESLQYTVDFEKQDCGAVDHCNESSQKNVDDQECALAQPAEQGTSIDEPKSVKCGNVSLRQYQAELAESALKGKNSIIVAPTDSGKTFVALAICDEHLRQRSGKGPKVIFLAPTLPVFQQQYERFRKHYQDESNRVSVGRVAGGAETPEPLDLQLKNNDVLIMTPQTLLNGLEKNNVCAIVDFSLIIFDECHHTCKNHPYNVIMQHYLGVKHGPSAPPLPQIVGLTASVGVGENKSLQGAIDHVLMLCANMDSCVISTVQRNLSELAQFVPIAQHNILQVGRRRADPFADIIKDIMAKVEDLLLSLNLPDSVPELKKEKERGTQQYEQWVIKVQREGSMISIPDKELEQKLCWSIFSCTSHLRKYNDALFINEDTRAKDAMNYLEKFFASLDPEGFIDIDETLANFFKEKLHDLQSCLNNPENENPKLLKLEEILRDEYQMNAATKSILFVKTRAISEAMESWINEIKTELPHLKPSKLIGRAKSKHHEGMTLNQQSGAVDEFREEQGSNLLIATSVADEGLDIQRCNLVLLYDYVGNVIKSVQTRGRGRAENSKCMLITTLKGGLAEKEKVNLLMEKVMYTAIENVQKLDPVTRAKKMEGLQKATLSSAEFQRMLQRFKKTEEDIYFLHCIKCKELVCKSSDIRLVENTHYTVISSAFMELVDHKPHQKPMSFDGISKIGKIHHKTCTKDWGITAIYKSLKLPIIKIQSFIFKKENSNVHIVLNKWKDFPGIIAVFSFEEIGQIGENVLSAE
ncbi:antiviral innate immune response receptor RIG-I [Petromyzon marinus]|uniref:antiviral innate immune response receptor RIG-I n=1 Tax=Petromyzon marinus TaxID=7757 RepID=UPI003F711E7C